MKTFLIILSLLWSVNVFSNKLKDCQDNLKTRFKVIRDGFHRLRQLAELPHISNPDAWLRDKLKENNTHAKCVSFGDEIVSLESKKSEFDAEVLARKTKRENFEAARIILRNADCDKINKEWDKALCIYMKGM